MTDEDSQSLGRAQRRLLRRIFNGRTVPIIADGKPFLTYKQASSYLQKLAPEASEAVYCEMKAMAHEKPEE